MKDHTLIEELLYTPKHSLIDQSLHSTMGAETTNGDGFGIGWYGVGKTPGVFHSVEPAWNDRNLHELSAHLETPILFGHDVIHGFRTEFPIPLGLASTWNPALVEKAARVAAQCGHPPPG